MLLFFLSAVCELSMADFGAQGLSLHLFACLLYGTASVFIGCSLFVHNMKCGVGQVLLMGVLWVMWISLAY